MNPNGYNTEQKLDLDLDTSDLESDDSEINMEPEIAKRRDMAEARAVSPVYPYENQAMFRAEHMEVEPNQLLAVKLKGNVRTFVIHEEVMGSEIGVCGCYGPPGVGGLVELPHEQQFKSLRHRCFDSVKIVYKKCD